MPSTYTDPEAYSTSFYNPNSQSPICLPSSPHGLGAVAFDNPLLSPSNGVGYPCGRCRQVAPQWLLYENSLESEPLGLLRPELPHLGLRAFEFTYHWIFTLPRQEGPNPSDFYWFLGYCTEGLSGIYPDTDSTVDPTIDGAEFPDDPGQAKGWMLAKIETTVTNGELNIRYLSFSQLKREVITKSGLFSPLGMNTFTERRFQDPLSVEGVTRYVVPFFP